MLALRQTSSTVLPSSDEDGYVRIVGRGKDLIISGGYNVYPKEIETEIDGIPGVIESAVIGLPHPDLDEAVTAVIVPVADAKVDEAEVQISLRQRLAGYKLSKRVIFLGELPRNAMVKVQTNVLRESFGAFYT